MQSEMDLLSEEYIYIEVERIKLLFEKNKYNKEQKIYFLEAKLIGNPSKEDIQISKILLEEIKGN